MCRSDQHITLKWRAGMSDVSCYLLDIQGPNLEEVYKHNKPIVLIDSFEHA